MEYTINGAKFYSEKGFYNYVESMFTFGLSWKIGRNLNAFADILEGGFGKHGCQEPITIYWENFKKSEERLDAKFMKNVIEIIEKNKTVELYVYDFRRK